MKINLYLVVFLFLGLSVKAQDPVFSQFFVNSAQLNPAFAGNTLAPRITINYRTQWLWAAPIQAYKTYAATYGQFFEPLNSSIGVMVQTDNAGDGIYKNSQAALIYGYRLQIGRDYFLKFGAEASLMQSSLNWNKLIFLDQLDPVDGNVRQTEDTPPDGLVNTYASIGAGFLGYGKNFYVGFGAKHLNTPDEAFDSKGSNLFSGLPMRLTFNAGGQITLQRGNNRQLPSFLSPSIAFIQQAGFRQLNLGSYLGYGSFFGGVWYRHAWTNSDAAIFLVGWEYDMFRIGYSYDFTVSGLAASSGGSGGASEITVVLT